MTAIHVLIVEGDRVWFSATPKQPDFGVQLEPGKPTAIGQLQVKLIRPRLFGRPRVRVSEHRASLIVNEMCYTGYRYDIPLDGDGWYLFDQNGLIERLTPEALQQRLAS